MDLDFAILTIDADNEPSESIEFTKEMPQKWDKIWSLGYPVYAPLVVSEGVYLGPDLLSGSGLPTVHTSGIASGMSGGPVLACKDGKFRAVGVITSAMGQPIVVGFMMKIPSNPGFLMGFQPIVYQ